VIRRFRGFWKGRLRPILMRIGHFQSTVLLTIIYVLLWLPVGIVTWLCADWLHRRPMPESGWFPRPVHWDSPEQLREPF